jgi:hypothetical protein
MDRYHESALRIAIPEESLLTVVQGLGGGGQAEPYVVNASNAITYGYVLHQKPSSLPLGLRGGRTLDKQN